MAYNIMTSGIGWQAIATKSTTQKHNYGQIVQAYDPTYGQGEFIYLKGVASTAVGSWVGYVPGTGVTILAVANGNYPIAVSMTTNTTTTSYAWYQISGMAQALGLTSITVTSGFLWLTSTAGSVDDASVIGDAIIGAKKTATVHVVGTFLDTYNIMRPQSVNRVLLSN